MRKVLPIILAATLLGFITSPVWSAGTLTVTTPNGGQKWTTGKKYTIKWSKGNAGAYVKIQLLKSGKAYKTIKAKTKNDGRHRWKVPSTVATGSQYKIKISSILDSGVTDLSNRNFTIANVDVFWGNSPLTGRWVGAWGTSCSDDECNGGELIATITEKKNHRLLGRFYLDGWPNIDYLPYIEKVGALHGTRSGSAGGDIDLTFYARANCIISVDNAKLTVTVGEREIRGSGYSDSGVWGFYAVEMTAEKRQQLADDLSVYLKDDSFTR